MRKIGYRIFAVALVISTMVLAGAAALPAESSTIKTPTTMHSSSGHYTWKVESKSYQGYTYGPWKTLRHLVVSKKRAPRDISFTAKTRVRGIDEPGVVTTVTVKLTKKNASAGTYYLKARTVSKYWKVKMRRYLHINGTKTPVGEPVYGYQKKFLYSEQTIVKK